MLKQITLLFGLLILAGSVVACEAKVPNSPSSSVFIYDEAIDPHEQVDTALKKANAEGKPILMQIGGNWCKDAKRLDAFYSEQPAVKQVIEEKFVFIRVNNDRENPNWEFFNKLPSFSWIPTLIILDAQGNIVAVREGKQLETNNEYDAQLILSFLNEGTK
ncbi:MAG: thioredoxin family protein [Symplocastrum torsivum CPER-KK1]|uniref:Thioredoxin family protein n=1 Tax=Symplocastrum torsivum CPER-KK1 TaxID=450513 RepID=A0A951UCX9_9CYAN|nr:thioredoxin family protein [Symplocastrum torsivum CPER-KK1]